MKRGIPLRRPIPPAISAGGGAQKTLPNYYTLCCTTGTRWTVSFLAHW